MTPVNAGTILFGRTIMDELEADLCTRIITPEIAKGFADGPASHSIHSAVYSSSRSDAYCGLFVV